MQKKQPLIKKNDKVFIISGKERANRRIGTVLKVDSEKNRVIVEKANIVKRHSKPTGKSSQGGIIEKEAPIHISNVMVICNKCAKPTRIGKRMADDGSKVRICKKCNESLD